MKKINILLLISVFFFTACEDVLDKEPLDIISDAAVWSDPVLINDYLGQCYAEMKFSWETEYNAPLSTFSGVTGFYTYPFHMVYSMQVSDEARRSWGPQAFKTNLININGGRLEWWGYPLVRKLNVFLENMAPMELDANYKKNRMAEARFLRAFCYFNMVKRYGGIPLITKVQQLDDPNEELYPTRDKEEVIYDFIVSEIDAIADDLPYRSTGPDYGRASKYAALALKSRAAMYAGSIATWGTLDLDGVVGIPQNKASLFWQASYDASEEIINNGGYALYEVESDKSTNFRNLFLDEGNTESIFVEQFNGLAGKGHTYDFFMVPKAHHPWNAGQTITLYLEMIESFDNIDGTSGIIDRAKIAAGYSWTLDELWGNKDPRFKASVYTQGTSWLNGATKLDYHLNVKKEDGTITNAGSYKGVLAKAPASASATPFGVLKYLDEAERSVVSERNHSDTDFMIFRLGEVLLNYAEAAIELGKDADALWAVNELRKRAGVQEYTEITRDLVRKERKVELAFEANRYWDLRRWRIAEEELSQVFHGLQFTLDGSSYEQGSYDPETAKYILKIQNNIDGNPAPFFDEMHYYLPISLSRTNTNPNLDENPGYE